jgi:hypothetical protein
MSQVVSFAEESCWEGERFRTVRRQIVFVLIGTSARLKKSVRREFTADFGLWYDVDDEWLIEILREEEPEIDWGYFVFFKKLDHSAITIHHPETNEVVASVIPRGRTKRKLSCENNGANVIHISEGEKYRAERIKREAERAQERCDISDA